MRVEQSCEYLDCVSNHAGATAFAPANDSWDEF